MHHFFSLGRQQHEEQHKPDSLRFHNGVTTGAGGEGGGLKRSKVMSP